LNPAAYYRFGVSTVVNCSILARIHQIFGTETQAFMPRTITMAVDLPAAPARLYRM
jgi:hypothetical protein